MTKPQTTDDFVKIPRALAEQIIRVCESDEMKSLYSIAYVHGCEYRGPQFSLDDLRRYVYGEH